MREMILYDSPIGRIGCTFEDSILIKIEFNVQNVVYPDCKMIDNHFFKKELDEYFRGNLMKFEQEIRFIYGTEFQKQVWTRVMKIPFGQTITYKDVADSIGLSKGFQAIGSALGKNPIPLVVPCHRVIGSDGSLKGFSYGINIKGWLLRHEKDSLKSIKNQL